MVNDVVCAECRDGFRPDRIIQDSTIYGKSLWFCECGIGVRRTGICTGGPITELVSPAFRSLGLG
jgi:hypothetical protein